MMDTRSHGYDLIFVVLIFYLFYNSLESGNLLFFMNLFPIIMDTRLHGYDSLYEYFVILIKFNKIAAFDTTPFSFLWYSKQDYTRLL